MSGSSKRLEEFNTMDECATAVHSVAWCGVAWCVGIRICCNAEVPGLMVVVLHFIDVELITCASF